MGWLAGTTGIQRAGRGGQVRRIPAGKGTTTQPEAVWYSGSLASTFIWQEPENCPRHGLPCTCHFRPLFRSPYLSKEWNHCFASTKEYPLTDALTLTIFVCTVQFNNFRSKSEESRDLLIQNLSCAKAILYDPLRLLTVIGSSIEELWCYIPQGKLILMVKVEQSSYGCSSNFLTKRKNETLLQMDQIGIGRFRTHQSSAFFSHFQNWKFPYEWTYIQSWIKSLPIPFPWLQLWHTFVSGLLTLQNWVQHIPGGHESHSK